MIHDFVAKDKNTDFITNTDIAMQRRFFIPFFLAIHKNKDKFQFTIAGVFRILPYNLPFVRAEYKNDTVILYACMYLYCNVMKIY